MQHEKIRGRSAYFSPPREINDLIVLIEDSSRHNRIGGVPFCRRVKKRPTECLFFVRLLWAEARLDGFSPALVLPTSQCPLTCTWLQLYCTFDS